MANHKAFKAREMMFGLKDEFDYFECAVCGSLQIFTEPADIARYYSGSYYSFRKDKPLVTRLKRAWASFSFGRLNIVGKLIAQAIGIHQGVRAIARVSAPRHATILDVGCGSGELIQLLASLGFTHLTGTDPFLDSDTELSGGSKLLKKNLHELGGSYDIVMFNHSLEHTFDPSKFIAQAAALLPPKGKLIIRIPIAGNFAWREYGRNWVSLDAPRHLCIPSRKGLLLMAECNKLALEEIYYESDEFMFWASEQYRNNIPLHSHKSHSSSILKRIFPNRNIRDFRKRAKDLNAIEDSDTVCAIFTK